MHRTSTLALCLLTLGAFAPLAPAQDLPVIRPGTSKPAAEPAKREAKEEPTASEHWQVILIEDDRIGYVRTKTDPLPAEGRQPARLRTHTEMKMTFKRFGQPLTMTADAVTVETMDGNMLSFEHELLAGESTVSRSVGTIDRDKLRIKNTIAGIEQSKSIPWDESIKSPGYQDRVLREEGLKPGETKNFRAFIPDQGVVSDIRITAEDMRDVKLPDGKYRRLLKAKVTQSVLPTMPATAYLDENSELVLVEVSMFGQTMKLFEVSKQEALRELGGAELDLAINTLVPATALQVPHDTKKVVYRIHVPGEDAASLFVDGGTQSVKTIDRETVEVTVTAAPISKRWGRVKADAEFIEPTALLQSDHQAVRSHLQRAVSPDRSEGEAAIALERYVHEKLNKKNFTTAFASAAEVAENLEGDCSEHAMLLAALLRARGIPSRVAVGLVYLPGQPKMGGHMWTEALFEDGWVPLDATLGRGGIGAGHIKVADSSLSDDAPLPVTTFAPLMSLGPKTRIEVVNVER